jgi:hypothetical protein
MTATCGQGSRRREARAGLNLSRQSTLSRYDATSPMALASCHASLGMLGIASP